MIRTNKKSEGYAMEMSLSNKLELFVRRSRTIYTTYTKFRNQGRKGYYSLGFKAYQGHWIQLDLGFFFKKCLTESHNEEKEEREDCKDRIIRQHQLYQLNHMYGLD